MLKKKLRYLIQEIQSLCKLMQTVPGFRSGDLASISGKNRGTWIGGGNVRTSDSFRVVKREGISYKNVTNIQENDEFRYQNPNLLELLGLNAVVS